MILLIIFEIFYYMYNSNDNLQQFVLKIQYNN